MKFAYHLVKQQNGDESLVIIPSVEDGDPISVRGDHPHFATIRELLDDPEATVEQLRELADLSTAVAQRFENLSERVTVANGRVYFDGDEVHGTITRLIIRALDSGFAANWRPLVRFMENVGANPTEHSREQLFDWLNARDFTITQAGEVVAYKGVGHAPNGGYQSLYAGGAIVNGERVEGNVPNAPGDVIELPRSAVAHDPSASCSHGLHVGTYGYAKAYANGALLKVRVNPRDVVSVPTDAGGDKVRVCRYRVVDVIDAPETMWIEGEGDDELRCDGCGERVYQGDPAYQDGYCPECD